MADRYEMVLDMVDNASNVLDQVKDKLLDLAQNASGTAKAFGIAGLAIGAAAGLGIAALNGISTAAAEAIKNINEIGVASARLGISAKDLQVLTGTFEVFGVKAEESIDALTDFTEKLVDARDGTGGLYDSLQKLKIGLTNIDGSAKSNITLFNEWFSAVVKMGDASDRVWNGAQVSDKMRDIVSQGGRLGETYDEVREKEEKLIKVTQAHVIAAQEAHQQTVLYNQAMKQQEDANALVLAPTAKWWDQIMTNTNKAVSSAKLYFQEIMQGAGLMDKGGPAQQLIALQARLAQQEKVLENVKATSNSEATINAFQERVDKIKAEIKALEVANPVLTAPVQNNQSTVNAQNQKQREAQDKAIAAAEKAAADARVRAIANTNEQIKAELALTNQRLLDEAAETIKTNKITGEEKIKLEKAVQATIAANTIAANNKISDNKKKLDETQAKQTLAVQNVIDGIQKQTDQLKAQNQTLTTNSREMEYQNELTEKLAAAKSANNNKDLDSVTINKIKTELLEKQAAARALEAAQQTKMFNDDIDNIKQQTDQAAALTQEQKNQLEVKQAITDEEKKLNRALTDNEKQLLTNVLIDKQKATATAELAQKNADEIKQIYANAAESIQGAFSDFFFDVMQGNLSNLADSFKKTIDRMVADLLAANLFKMVGGIGTGVAGESNLSGFFASIFGGISGRATGGPTTANRPYWVGEEGPEIVIPSASSTVIPADLSSSIASGQGGNGSQPMTVNNINIKALDSKSVIQMIEDNDRDIVTKLADASQRYGIK